MCYVCVVTCHSVATQINVIGIHVCVCVSLLRLPPHAARSTPQQNAWRRPEPQGAAWCSQALGA